MTWFVGALVAITLLIVLAAVIPVRTREFVSRAAPVHDYARAIARVARQQHADDSVVAVGGRSVLLTHGAPTSRVVVLLHGLTNSPRQFERLAARLHAAGDNVYIPRLPHHAERNGTAASLAGLTADELRHYADAAVDVAVALGQSIIVAGVSAGGTVAAWIVQNRADVHRAVIIAPVLEIARVPSFLAAPLMNLGLRLPNVTRLLPPDPRRPDRERGVASHAVAELLRFGASVRQAATRRPPHACDIIFVVNANDHTVKTSPVIELKRCWTEHGASAVIYQFPLALGLPHDIAEEAHANANPAVVYPALQALIHGEPPPNVLADSRLCRRDPRGRSELPEGNPSSHSGTSSMMKLRQTGLVEHVRRRGVLAGSAAWSGSVMTRRARAIDLAPPPALAVQPVSFRSASGSTIRAWLLGGRQGVGAVLLLHGVGDDRSSMVARARFLHHAGYAVLLPDFQAHGESEGARITFGALESLDVMAALEYLRASCRGERVGMIGVSMGGAAALLASGRVPAEAYVLESVYPTVRQALEGRLGVWLGPFARLKRSVASLVVQGVSAEIGIGEETLRPIDHIGSLDAPVFVISGTRDTYTSLDESLALFEHAREPKEFWGVEGARHEDLHAFASGRYEQRVGEFLAMHLGRS